MMAVPGPITQPLMVAIRCPTSGGARTGSPNGNRRPSLVKSPTMLPIV